jgi:hypothetical protein
MNPLFAFSFDRDTWSGSYPTRQQALDAALKALKDRSDVPEGIFIAQWVETDPQSTDHAEAVIEQMRDRWHASSEAGSYLDHVNEQQSADLDHEMDRCIRAWLAKHDLLPRPTKVRAISEHPVPNVHHVPVPTHERETSLIGEA